MGIEREKAIDQTENPQLSNCYANRTKKIIFADESLYRKRKKA